MTVVMAAVIACQEVFFPAGVAPNVRCQMVRRLQIMCTLGLVAEHSCHGLWRTLWALWTRMGARTISALALVLQKDLCSVCSSRTRPHTSQRLPNRHLQGTIAKPSRTAGAETCLVCHSCILYPLAERKGI
jgi:hypothetical protein